jgi:hypothetical protein
MNPASGLGQQQMPGYGSSTPNNAGSTNPTSGDIH